MEVEVSARPRSTPIQIEREFFTTVTGLGSPGFAAQVGPIAGSPGARSDAIP
jgi:hypothetical protein